MNVVLMTSNRMVHGRPRFLLIVSVIQVGASVCKPLCLLGPGFLICPLSTSIWTSPLWGLFHKEPTHQAFGTLEDCSENGSRGLPGREVASSCAKPSAIWLVYRSVFARLQCDNPRSQKPVRTKAYFSLVLRGSSTCCK